MPETAPNRLAAIRAALHELVAEYGFDPLSDPGRMSNLIKDLLPDDQQLARILVVAAEQDVASTLREHVAQGMPAPTAIRLVATSFAASTMFAPQACSGVVSELAIAMGLAPADITQDAVPGSVADFPGGPTDVTPGAGSTSTGTGARIGAGIGAAGIGAGIGTAADQAQDVPGQVQNVPGQAQDARPAAARPGLRRRSYLAIAATGIVVVAAALILALRGGPAATSAHAPHKGNVTVNHQFARDDSFVLTLTTITLRDNRLTVDVAYHNATNQTQILTCLGETDPTTASLTLANGTIVHSIATYCSDHPSLASTLGAGQTHTSYAVFLVPKDFPEPVSFFWEAGDLSGTVSHLRV